MLQKIVNYETAKLAKEKGFSERLNSYFLENGNIEEFNDGENYSNSCFSTDWFKENYPNIVSAPTQYLLSMWLMDSHLLLVSANRDLLGDVRDDKPFYFDNEKWIYSIDDLLVTTEGIAQMRGYEIRYDVYKSYEEAFEAGLQKALNLI